MSSIVRKYEDLPLMQVVSDIFMEVVRYGCSEGWSTEEPAFLAIIKEKLAKFNIYLVNEKKGRWELREPLTIKKEEEK